MPKPPAAPGRIPEDDNDDVPADAARVRAEAATDLRCPEGAALFENTTDQPVRFTLRDEGNRPQRIECEPKGNCIVPVEYADVVPKRAPQLRFVTSRARRPVTED